MCQTITPLCTPIDSDINSVAAAIGVIASIIGFIPGPGEAIGLILGTFSSIILFLWPENKTIVWEEFTHRGLNLIRPELSQEAIEIIVNPLKGYYNALLEQLRSFEREFAIWDNNRNPSTTGDGLRRFSAIDAAIITLKHQLTINVSNKPALLSLYAQTANIDLILYQRGAKYGDEWARYTRNQPIPFKTSKEYYTDLKTKIKDYTNDIAQTYRDGLNIIKNKPNISWDVFNEYRREITLSALDLVALFQNYDICIYPIQTKTELTRKVYMPSFYLQALQQSNIETMENLLTHPPSLFTWLNELDLYTVRENYSPSLLLSSLSGLQAKSRYTQNSTIFYNPAQGVGTGTPTRVGLANLFIYKIFMSQYHHPNACYPIAGISDMTFYKSDYNGNMPTSQTYQAGRNSNNIINTFMNGPQNASTSNNISINQTKHILSDIKMVYSRTGGIYPLYDFGYSFAWTHTSVDPDNLIVPNRITQIPAVKAYTLTSPARVIAGPGHTGGDLVALLNSGTQSGSMEIRCKTGSFTGASRRYGIRMRYAANNAFTVSLSYTLQGGNTLGTTFVTEHTFSRTNNIIPTDLKYEEFKYKEYNQIITMTSPQNTIVTINIRQLNPSSNDQLIIDRIEFYPLDQGVAACTVN
ncbi:insecticidal delta-endotoxin Cry8Ea1 family protein [Bacillus cereus]|nr:insecticidal delta-endotoxin Cry8Ea1 family protein [Bacillus cereus]MEB9570769.1 insecticidal delta-endotoxin Cry8Ea1 family protein [Bacillus cereus]